MPMIRRRTFLERLGLGAGALLLGPSIDRLVRQAHGQTRRRRRFVLMIQGNGMEHTEFTPPGYRASGQAGTGKEVFIGELGQLPSMFGAQHPAIKIREPSNKGLEPFKNELLLCDGLSNQTGEIDHGAWWGAVTCVPNLPQPRGEPGGPSFDQYLAQSPAVTQGTVFPSIALGCRTGGKGEGGTAPDPTFAGFMFASGARKPLPVALTPSAAYKQYIAGAVKDPSLPAGPPPYARRKKLLDFVREDVRRARAALGGVEKEKLDQVLLSFETLDKQMSELMRVEGNTRITLEPVVTDPPLEGRVKLHFQIWTTALVAGLTNIVAFSAGARTIGSMWRGLGFELGAHQHGHREWSGEPLVKNNPGLNPLNEVHKFHAALLADTITTLKSVPDGDGTLFDNTLVAWYSDCAETHHPYLHRWPVLLATGEKNGFWKPFGKYVRYPLFSRAEGGGGEFRAKPTAAVVARTRPPGGRCLADLFCTIAHWAGAPTDRFGAGGTENVQGPLPELVA
jgi:hypothetical protein